MILNKETKLFGLDRFVLLVSTLSFLLVVAIVVAGVREVWHVVTILSADDTVYSGELVDLSVEDDESYVAAGVIVHNCHHSIRWLTREEADRIGITDASTMPEPADGFGENKVEALPASLKAA